MDLFHPEQEPVTGSCQHGNELYKTSIDVLTNSTNVSLPTITHFLHLDKYVFLTSVT
jgi:hypothetical protein